MRLFILVLPLLWLFIIGATKRVYENPNGTLRIKTYSYDYKKSSESEKEFMDRIDAEEGDEPVFNRILDVDETELPLNKSESHKWRIKNNKVEFDPNAPDTPEIISRKNKESNRNQAKAKLKAGQPLTDEMITALFGD